MKLRLLLPLTAALLLTACASAPVENPSFSAALVQAGVTGPTLVKMQHGEALHFSDILYLVEKKVPTHLIESYLQSTEKVYQFGSVQMNALRSAGASAQLLSYLAHTGGFYAPGGGSTGHGLTSAVERQAANNPLAEAQQPFAYNPPIVDCWYHSAYEESLYSPFSFNGE